MQRPGVHRQVVVEAPEQYGIALTRLDFEIIRAAARQVTSRAQGTCSAMPMHTHTDVRNCWYVSG